MMKVINHIRIKKETVNEILKLDAVERVELWHNGNIVVFLNADSTEGKREAFKDEYLVRWENGNWQRFGEAAYQLLLKNPGKEAGRQWSE